MTNDRPRLIEVAFPLKQASLDSVHEKNVRHGHISTLHIWPARRPLAACRAALIATLLPDPGTEVERKRLLELLAGHVVTRNTTKRVGERTIPVIKEETEGGILHWGRENGPALDFFREEIKKAYGGRTPRVLDPFAGGGAIPLEAMRLGCEVTAIDINPVAWFILKCTLEYPQRLAGQTRPLPEWAQALTLGPSPGRRGKIQQPPLPLGEDRVREGDLADHVRAWGHWVLERARRDLERFYPTVDGKPTVAYLWARTVACKNCRATIPLLKTLWLCKKDNKRWRLEIKPRADLTGVGFEVVPEPVKGGNAGQRRTYDQEVGRGTMSRSGAWCPVCSGPGTVAMTLEDIRAEGMAGRLSAQMTAVVVDGPKGKEYRLPTPEELQVAQEAATHQEEVFRDTPFGLPAEPIIENAKRDTWCVPYGVDRWHKVFTARQLVSLGTILNYTRSSREAMRSEGYPPDWVEAVCAYLALSFDRLASFCSVNVRWKLDAEAVVDTFARFALPVLWDFAEAIPIGTHAGAYSLCFERICRAVDTLFAARLQAFAKALPVSAVCVKPQDDRFDLVLTDPPYYNSIGYSVLMDFFYVWLRRTSNGLSRELDAAFQEQLGPKWDYEANDGELVDDAARFGGDPKWSKDVYETGMFKAFCASYDALKPLGRMVIVFANKQPDAWETLVSSMIRAGFVVSASWPIQTEMGNRTRALTSAALASSVWLVCRKRPEPARPGWDTQVLEEMRSKIYERLREFWDAGIRGPDFVWAATGPALEAYSKHPVVKKADEPNSVLTVPEFLHTVRRIVVDYVVGRVLSHNGANEAVANLDTLTIYYLLHRHDFGLAEAPAGACILYAQSCNLRDRDLADRYDLVAFVSGRAAEEGEDEEDESGADEESASSGSLVKLKRWDQRRAKNLGLDAAGRPAPLIDQVHRMMHLWKEGDVRKVDGFMEERGLRRNPAFPKLLQALIELAGKDGQPDERALLEAVMNHITGRGAHPQMRLIAEE